MYTTIANIIERPDGIRIAAIFIAGILIVSLVSRIARSTELRATSVTLDAAATAYVRAAADSPGGVRLIAHEPANGGAERYNAKLLHASRAHRPVEWHALFIEVTVADASEFEEELFVEGVERHGFGVLAVRASSVPTAIAAVALHLRDEFDCAPHIYFRWSEGGPIRNFTRFLLLGEGENALMTREVLREAEPDMTKRPWVHVA